MELATLDASKAEREDYSDSEEGSSDEDYADVPSGPIDPEKCLAAGPGFAGGAAGSQLSFKITAKDSRGTRIREGGSYVTARLVPGSSAKAAGAETVVADVIDNKDGTYVARYKVPVRGDWELIVEINGTPIGGSPFPVFFSPPDPNAEQSGAATSDGRGTELGGPQDLSSALTAALPHVKALESQLLAALPPLLPPSLLAAGATAAKVVYPEDEDELKKTVLVGNLSPLVNLEQIKTLFSFVGPVTDVRFAGEGKQFAFVAFETERDANSAIGMNNMNLVDRNIKVESTRVAKAGAADSSVNPFAALQMQQMVQIQMAQLHSQSLAAQVAAMRAQAKTSGAPIVPGLPPNSASQKAAALTAIAALSKRLNTEGGAPAPREQSPPRARGRRPVSPTIRYRSKKSRSRSRSRSRGRRERSRHRSRERRGGRSRSISRDRDRDRIRQRDREREREREREWERERERERARERERERERIRARERDGERERRRDDEYRRRERDRWRESDVRYRDNRDVDYHRDRDRQQTRKRDWSPGKKREKEDRDMGSGRRESRESPADGNPKERGRSPRRRSEGDAVREHEDRGASHENGLEGTSTPDRKAVEGSLREKALQALKAKSSIGKSGGEEGGSPPLADDIVNSDSANGDARDERAMPHALDAVDRNRYSSTPSRERKAKKEKRHSKRDKDKSHRRSRDADEYED